MTSFIKITKDIILTPYSLNHIRESIMNELKLKYEDKCVDHYGLILSIHEIVEFDNIINKDSIHITFTVTFNAYVFRPIKDMDISFIPNLILEKGVFGEIYNHIHLFVPIEYLEENGYQFSMDTFQKEDHVIDTETEISVKIVDIRYYLLKYNCVTKLNKV